MMRQNMVAVLAAKSGKDGYGKTNQISLSWILGQDFGIDSIIANVAPVRFGDFEETTTARDSAVA